MEPYVAHVGLRECPTPACGWVKGMTTNGPADVIRVGKRYLPVCQCCGAKRGVHQHELQADN